MIHRVIAVMLNQIVKEIDVIYDLSGFIATLDIILSFALVSFKSLNLIEKSFQFIHHSLFVWKKTSANENYVCPSFGDEMRIIDAVHPLLEQNIHRTVAIPNNVVRLIQAKKILQNSGKITEMFFVQ